MRPLIPNPAAFAIRIGSTILLAACASVASAGVYKCARDDGTVMYQEDPCPPGKELRDFEREPASLSVIPFRIPNEPVERTPSPRNAASSASKSDRPSRKSDERGGSAARANHGLGTTLRSTCTRRPSSNVSVVTVCGSSGAGR